MDAVARKRGGWFERSLSEIVGSFAYSFKRNINKKFSQHLPQYEQITHEQGSLEFRIGGMSYFESVFDQDFFEKDWFTPLECNIIREYERYVKGQYKESGPRKYSGMPQHFHIDSSIKELFSIAKEENPITKKTSTQGIFGLILVNLGHEIVEDHPDYQIKKREWHEAVLKREGTKIKAISVELDRIAKHLIEDQIKNLQGAALRYGATREDMQCFMPIFKETGQAIFGLSRQFHSEPYPLSMARAFTRQENENYRVVFMKATAKGIDRSKNTQEIHPYNRQPLEDFHVLYSSNSEAGSALRRSFSDSKPDATQMPRAIMVQTAANTVFALHYLDRSIEKYSKIPQKTRSRYAKGTEDYLGLAILARQRMLASSISLIQLAIEQYEADPDIKKGIGNVNLEIENKKKGSYFDTITVPGTLSKMIVYDAGGGKFIQKLDSNPDDKQQIYLMAKELEEVLRRYVSKKDAFEKMPFRLWRLTGMDALLSILQNPFDQYAAIANYRPRKGISFSSLIAF